MPSDYGIAINISPDAEDKPAPGLPILTLVLATILLVRIAGLVFASTDLHSDEAQYWSWSHRLPLIDPSQLPVVVWLIGIARATCGDSEACIRLGSPVLFAVAAFLIYLLAHRLYGARVAFWSAVVYATLPAVSAFAMVATPEGALSALWIAGLLAVSVHLDRPTLATGLAVGAAVGLGLLTDYSMIYLPLCTALYVAFTPSLRSTFRAPATWLAITAAILVLSPQLLQTPGGYLSASLAVFISDWTYRHLNPDATFVFIALQFVLFGPILFFVFLRTVLLGSVTQSVGSDRFLLFHSAPIFAILLFQVLFFKAQAHWSLPAFAAAAILVTALLLRYGFRSLFLASIGVHFAVLAGILGLSIFAAHLDEVPYFDRMIGWRQFAEELSRAAALSEVNTIVLRGGSTVAEASYYLRDTNIKILVFGRATALEDQDSHWVYGDPETVLLATDSDPSTFGIPVGNADKIGSFPTQSWLSFDGTFSLYRVNPPDETPPR